MESPSKAKRSGPQASPAARLFQGLSAEFTQAHGQAILDQADGVFSFEVSGLSDKDAFKVWLVDNRPGPRHSVKPEPGDGLVKLGRLDHGQGMGRLEARIDRQALKGFKLDQVVVAKILCLHGLAKAEAIVAPSNQWMSS